jgi:hypothetical protein
MLETSKLASRAVRLATRATIALKVKTAVGDGAAVLRARREVVAAKARRATIVGNLGMLRASAEQARVEVDGEGIVGHLVVMRVRPEAMVAHLEGMMVVVVARRAITVGRLVTLRASVDKVRVGMAGPVEVVAEEEDQGEGGKSFVHTETRLWDRSAEIDLCMFLSHSACDSLSLRSGLTHMVRDFRPRYNKILIP